MSTILNFAPAIFALMGMVGVGFIMFRDRSMSLRRGLPLAGLFALWGYLQVRVTMHYDAELERLSWFIMPAVLILLGGHLKRRLIRELPGRLERTKR